MKKFTACAALLMLCSFVVAPSVFSQNYDLSIYAENELNSVAEPVVKLFGNLAGTGFVNSAGMHGIAGFDIGVRTNFSFIPSEFEEQRGPLNDVSVVPLPLLQASVGLPANLELTGRIFNYELGEETDGGVTVVGALVKYGLFQPPLMPKVVLVGGYHALITPDDYDFGTFHVVSLKGFVSHNFLVFTAYAGGGIDRASSTVKIDAGANSGFEKSYSETGATGTVGLTVSPFPFVKANADYNFGEFNNVSIGLTFSFR